MQIRNKEKVFKRRKNLGFVRSPASVLLSGAETTHNQDNSSLRLAEGGIKKYIRK